VILCVPQVSPINFFAIQATISYFSQRKLDGSGLRTGTASYGYDQLDRLISNHHPFDAGDTKVGFKLDNAGNVLAEAALDGAASDIQGFAPTTFSYTNNRLTARDPAAGADDFTYQYDKSGNQEFERRGTAEPPVGTANSYDAASHPQKTTTEDGEWAEYTYDGLGRQVTRKTDSGETTLVFHFGLVDQSAVEQTTGGPDDPKTTRYLLNSFGAPLGQQVTVHATPDVVTSSYFVPDLRGNLSQMLGSGSTIKGIFAYDPYGKAKQDLDGSGDPTAGSLTNLAEGSDSRLRYQMAPHDPLTGNYNLGPRLLNPNINRFVGADFYAAGAANMALQVDPLTGNRYMYAGANPAGLIDDGHKFGPFECFGPKDADGGCTWRTDLRKAPAEIQGIPMTASEGVSFGLEEIAAGGKEAWQARNQVLEPTQDLLDAGAMSAYGLAATCATAAVLACGPGVPEAATVGLTLDAINTVIDGFRVANQCLAQYSSSGCKDRAASLGLSGAGLLPLPRLTPERLVKIQRFGNWVTQQKLDTLYDLAMSAAITGGKKLLGV
jgi:RHS repeat-associated protein